MIDMHHDLLSIMYYSYLMDDYSYLKEWISNFNSDKVSGLLANLYFMNEDEMKEEINIEKINVVEMFKKSIEIFNNYLPDEKVIFSIEGCDYINDTDELEELYKLGLRNILLVWNNKNKYGSGNRSDIGLTEKGREFLIKAIDLGISLDLSHMNKNTFYDTINLIKEQMSIGKKVKVIASHSNCYSLCNHIRNLDDEQIKALKEVDGILGLVSYSMFVSDNNNDLKLKYLEHIKYAVNLLDIDHVGISSDDMNFINDFLHKSKHIMTFNYNNIRNELYDLLKNDFNAEEIEKIMYKNIYDKLFKEEKL